MRKAIFNTTAKTPVTFSGIGPFAYSSIHSYGSPRLYKEQMVLCHYAHGIAQMLELASELKIQRIMKRRAYRDGIKRKGDNGVCCELKDGSVE